MGPLRYSPAIHVNQEGYMPGLDRAFGPVQPLGLSRCRHFLGPDPSAPAGLHLSNARFTWEGRDQSPVYGAQSTFTPVQPGTQWAEVEAHLPDGRRVFARRTFTAQ